MQSPLGRRQTQQSAVVTYWDSFLSFTSSYDSLAQHTMLPESPYGCVCGEHHVHQGLVAAHSLSVAMRWALMLQADLILPIITGGCAARDSSSGESGPLPRWLSSLKLRAPMCFFRVPPMCSGQCHAASAAG